MKVYITVSIPNTHILSHLPLRTTLLDPSNTQINHVYSQSDPCFALSVYLRYFRLPHAHYLISTPPRSHQQGHQTPSNSLVGNLQLPPTLLSFKHTTPSPIPLQLRIYHPIQSSIFLHSSHHYLRILGMPLPSRPKVNRMPSWNSQLVYPILIQQV
jgi:hypothetical protein